jgi:hypothetical protein
MIRLSLLFSLIFLLIIQSSITNAEAQQPVIINNNNSGGGYGNQAPCNPYPNYNGTMRPGTYTIQTGPGGQSDTVYTTGDKQPYYVDSPCGNSGSPAVVQPYVYGPNVGPGTNPGPVRMR